ncbi:MAG: amidohydrolase family protein [Enterococcaceae bacterium]|jgi:guanine deaminase|nr:amidohydrolase family protein [Enterococcaceae bacterium]MCI1918573.1 amidohydrolase family protein [Enterococcaceae bacterium]
MTKKVFKGIFIHTPTKDEFVRMPQYLIVNDGVIEASKDELTDEEKKLPIEDFGNKIVIPSFVDLHVHAPQFPNDGVGYDEELLPWLNKYTFPTEAKIKDPATAKKVYMAFLDDLWRVGTLHFSAFATLHKDATYNLMKWADEAGLQAFIGKVNMDRNSDEALSETTQESIEDTEALVKATRSFKNVHYILTPRFVPSTTPELMTALADLAEKYDLPIQSHLSENRSELDWVASLHPECESYTDVYEHYGLLRKDKTIMAHCIYVDEKERQTLKKYGVYIAHSPASNANLASGIMPARVWLNEGLRVTIASDIAGGNVPDQNRNIVTAIQLSKLRWVEHPEEKPLSSSEAFYMATKAGGEFFGKVGSFENGSSFNALALEEDSLLYADDPLIRLEEFLYTGDDRNIKERFINGEAVKRPSEIVK